jgi:hypothetical protein
MGTGGIVRGCGTRVGGGIYAECPLSPFGCPLEDFLCDPPIPVDANELGITPVGVKLIERNGVWHLLDWVGSSHYKNVADYFEEVRRYGMSRRLSATLDFKKLTAQSRILLLHSNAWIENFEEYSKSEPAEELLKIFPYSKCPKNLPEHQRDKMESCCFRFLYQDISGGDHHPEGDKRTVYRKMPSFDYYGLKAPENVKPKYQLAIFASFPITNLAVINDPEGGTHEKSINLAQVARIPVNLEDE